jgi:hypothetical protein
MSCRRFSCSEGSCDYADGEEIVKEGALDDRFDILVTRGCAVERHGQRLDILDTGDCFGEVSYAAAAVAAGMRPHSRPQLSGASAGVSGHRPPAR